MNKIIINILLFSTLVIGSIGLITFDVWADDSEVYSIPDDYEKNNFTFEWSYCRNKDTLSSTFDFSNYYLDIDIYYPKNCLICPYFKLYNSNNYRLDGFNVYMKDDNGMFSGGEGKFDIYKVISSGNILKQNFGFTFLDGSKKDVDIYMVLNDYHQTLSHRSLKKEDCSTSTKYYKYISSPIYINLDYDSIKYSFSQPFILYKNTGYKYVTFNFDDLSSSIYLDGYSQDKRVSELCKFYKNFLDIYNDNVYPEPQFYKALRLGDTGTLQIMYKLDFNKKLPIKVFTYNKIYVKLQGEKDWRTMENSEILGLQKDKESGRVSGILRFSDIVDSLNLKEATFEAVIWGVRYAYSTGDTSTDLKNKVYATPWIFSRYILTENIIDEPDVSVDDLGNLKDVSNSSSGTNIKIDNVGGSNTGNKNNFDGSNIIATDEADYSDVGSFFKSLNFDFSSIGKALSGSFSLVTGFASMIGSIFQNFFGDAVGIIALLAIGICIVLRVLGR